MAKEQVFDSAFSSLDNMSRTAFSLYILQRILSETETTLYHRARSPLQSVPGPWLSKWTSVVLQYHWFRGQRAFYVERLHREYGPVVCLGPNEVAFNSASAAKKIHSYTRPFRKGELYSNVARYDGQDNVFAARDPQVHARLRRLLSGPMSESSLKGVEHVVKAKADLAVDRMVEEMKTRGAADVMQWWMFFSTDVIGELSFGESFRMLEIGKKNQYVEDLEKVALISGLRIGFPTLMKIFSYLPLFRESRNADLRLQRYAIQSIQRYKNIIAADPWNPTPTLFTKLFKAGEEGLSQEEIVNSAEVYIIAGSDTTAHTLTYLIWAVCRDREVKRRLVEEVAGLEEAYTNEDLKRLLYLGQVLDETLRLFCAAPSGLPRDVPDGGCDVDGYWMPGGTTVSTQAYSMHRDTAIFPEPEKFDPLRWENPSKQMRDNSMPFGGGARSCIGVHLAYMELRFATARFFRAFPNANISSLEGFSDEDMEQVIYFLMFPKNKRCLIQAS
ncbi:cytochrome protein [Pleomassaria siparia CBS 279.74]|uniref:Cytochrome protein n=1 Tax=Pleomassaria siparia CBS 279.74 TaxID=1314801 RepID=A0A6G1KJ36_9PLEO|nr:cytochrome protein [Pleomassaria siparia CBS 279.74]